MVEEYESVINNNVWDIFLRLTNKLVVGSKWIFNVKHVTYESIEKYKAIFVVKNSLRLIELTMRKHLLV